MFGPAFHDPAVVDCVLLQSLARSLAKICSMWYWTTIALILIIGRGAESFVINPAARVTSTSFQEGKVSSGNMNTLLHTTLTAASMETTLATR